MNKHYWLYVLRLEQGKYYIGTTVMKNPEDRIQQHKQGFYSAQWVKKYKFIEPIEKVDLGTITQTEADDLENHRTLQYMKKYGYQNVRGGQFNYSGKYVKIGNRFWREENFETLVTIIFLLIIIAALGLMVL